MRKIWSDEAWKDYLYWQTQDKKTLKRINRLLENISRNGYQCTGKPEALSGNLAEFWNVRIDEKTGSYFGSITMQSKSRSAARITRNKWAIGKAPTTDCIVYQKIRIPKNLLNFYDPIFL